jgi:hypothetical protein
MADDNRDDTDKQDGFDPWADLESDPPADQTEQFSFTFDDAALDAELDATLDDALDASASDEPVQRSFAEEPIIAEGTPEVPLLESTADDALVNAWLDDPADEPVAPAPLAVFAPDEPGDVDGLDGFDDESESAFDPEAIEIGTGHSGIESASEVEGGGFVGEDSEASTEAAEAFFGAVGEPESPEDEIVESVSFVESDAEASEEADIIDFATAAAGVAAAAAASGGRDDSIAIAATKSRPGGKARNRGGIGQLVGIVLGGLMAIPIVLGILIGLMWMGWEDTAGIRTWLPTQAAFLLPPANRGATRAIAGGPDLSAAPSLDDLPTTPATEPAPDSGAEPAPERAAVSADEPAVAPMPQDDEPAVPSMPQDPEGLATSTEPATMNPTGEPKPGDLAMPLATPPSLDDVAALVTPQEDVAVGSAPMPVEPIVPAVPEPEPLDTSGLERAVAEASTALEAVQGVGDPADPARKALLVEWYKQLVRVAEELAMLERVAADSGRPLAATPEVAADHHHRILAAPERLDDLARLARNWLAYDRREGDGIVMPATFAGARQVGPYWYSRVSMAEAGGRSREVAVISRAEPAAAAGDAVLISGLVLDGDVLWAVDVRSAAAQPAISSPPVAPATAAEPDPFGLPDL